MIPTLDIARHIWITDEGYRKINSLLLGPKYKYFRKDYATIEFEGEEYPTTSVVNVIRQNMKCGAREITYYRGESGNISQESFVRKSFTSLTRDKEQAESFMDDDCCVYTVVLDPEVKRIPIGVEDEILVENDVYWKYLGNNRARIYKQADDEHDETSDKENRDVSQFHHRRKYIYDDDDDDFRGGRRQKINTIHKRKKIKTKTTIRKGRKPKKQRKRKHTQKRR